MMFKRQASLALSILLICMLIIPAPLASAHTPNTTTDPLTNYTKIYSRTSNWMFDTTNAAFFGGDTSRLVRTNTSSGSIVYRMTTGIKHFAVTLHAYAGSTGVMRLYGSTNNSSWTEIQTENNMPQSSGDPGWRASTYTPKAALPTGFQYLKVELSGDGANWPMQLGSVTLSDVAALPDQIDDDLSDTSKVHSYTSNLMFDTTNPAYFGGDGSRVVRTNLSTASFVYHLHDTKNFSASVHKYAGSTGVVKFYRSSNGTTWTEMASTASSPAPSGHPSWMMSTYSPANAIPGGAHYVKVELSGDSVNWAMQIGSVTLSNYVTGDYYVDSINGSDSNDGRSESAAWKTFANINGKTFVAGDRILLRKGSIWSGQLYPKGSGSSEAPIVISSYGSGNRPIINGGGIAGGTVYLRNASYWTIENLEVTNTASERGNVYREGILVENANGGVLSHIQIINNYVHDVTGSFRYPIEAGYSGGPHAFGGISVYTGGNVGTDKFDHVLIEGNTVEKVGRTGIVVWDQKWNSTGFATTNVVIRQNYVKESDSDGILTFGVNGALIEHNVAEGIGWYSEPNQFNGSAAIWSTRGENNVIQFNEAFNTRRTEGDGQGFNLDMDSKDSVVQYNYSHDNEGGFMLLVDAPLNPGVENGSENSVVRYNISQNDWKHTFTFAGGVTEGTEIYNNTIYIGKGKNVRVIDHEWDDAGDLNKAYEFKNNLVYNLGIGAYYLPGTNGVFDSNLFYGNHPLTEPSDANKIIANPQLVYQGSGAQGWGSVDGYKLREGSPALGAGTVISGNGGLDYWGNAVSSSAAPNIGAYNGPGLDPNTLPAPPDDEFVPYYQGLSLIPAIANDSNGTKSIKVKFANLSSETLEVEQFEWSLGSASGTVSAIPSIAPNGEWIYNIPLPNVSEGVQYPFELTAEIEGYETLHISRSMDFNRVMHQSDSSSPVTIDLADGTVVMTGYAGASDLSGEVKLRWDATNLYLTADMIDDVHSHSSSGIYIFQNDGLQFGIAPGIPGESQSWYEYGISQTPTGPQIYRWLTMQGAAAGLVTNGNLQVTRNETTKTTSYSLVLPWSELAPMLPAQGGTFSFSLIVNDNDGAGRKGYIEWGSGVGGVKDAAVFRNMIIM